MDESGVSETVAVGAFIGSEFLGTMSLALDLFSTASLRKVLTVLCMFIVLWVGGLLLISGCVFQYTSNSKHRETAKSDRARLQRNAQAAKSPAAIREFLVNYVTELFPSAFRNKPNLERALDEVTRHHRYYQIISPTSEKSDYQRILTGVQLLTVQTMLMFLLALFYDIQGPSDDGSCVLKASEEECLARQSIMDRRQHYCQWTEAKSGAYSCEYNPPSFGWSVIIYLSVLVSIVTAFVNLSIDWFFDLIGAPAADPVKVNAAEGVVKMVGRGAVQAARRVSVTARRVSVAAGAALSAMSATAQERVKRATRAGYESREFPLAAKRAHDLAVATRPSIVAQANEIVERRVRSRLEKKSKYEEAVHRRNAEDGVSDDDDDDDSYEASDADSVSSDEESRESEEKEDGVSGGMSVVGLGSSGGGVVEAGGRRGHHGPVVQ